MTSGPRRRSDPERSSIASVLVVCTGNVCRSPFAAGALSLLAPGITVASAGTHALQGSPMDPPMARQLAQRGGDPTGHRARQLLPAHTDADLVLVMTRGQRRLVLEEDPALVSRLGLLGAVPALEAVDPGSVSRWARSLPAPDAEIPDPYGHGEDAARIAAGRLWTAVSHLASLLSLPSRSR